MYFTKNFILIDGTKFDQKLFLRQVVQKINDFTIHSNFNVTEIVNSYAGIFIKEFYSDSNKLKIAGKYPILRIEFDGEGVNLRMIHDRYDGFENGIISFQFEPESHFLMKALIDLIEEINSDKGIASILEEKTSEIENKYSCNCATIETDFSGGSPLLPRDFTSE